MSPRPFTPTGEQTRIIGHAGSAFVAACPGAGKTRVLVERARSLLAERSAGRGIAVSVRARHLAQVRLVSTDAATAAQSRWPSASAAASVHP